MELNQCPRVGPHLIIITSCHLKQKPRQERWFERKKDRCIQKLPFDCTEKSSLRLSANLRVSFPNSAVMNWAIVWQVFTQISFILEVCMNSMLHELNHAICSGQWYMTDLKPTKVFNVPA